VVRVQQERVRTELTDLGTWGLMQLVNHEVCVSCWDVMMSCYVPNMHAVRNITIYILCVWSTESISYISSTHRDVIHTSK